MHDSSKPKDLDVNQARWHKSSLSTDTNCVEMAQVDGYVAIRDSKNPDKSALIFTKDEWRAFVGGVHQNEFDVK